MLLDGALVWHSIHAGDDRADQPGWNKAQGSKMKRTHMPTEAGWLRFLELRGDSKSAEL